MQGGDVPITTRREDVAESVLRTRGKPIQLMPLGTDDSAALLLERANLPTNGSGQLNEVLGVVHKLGCHPLALQQAGAMMRQRKRGIDMLQNMLHGASYSTVRMNPNHALNITSLTEL